MKSILTIIILAVIHFLTVMVSLVETATEGTQCIAHFLTVMVSLIDTATGRAHCIVHYLTDMASLVERPTRGTQYPISCWTLRIITETFNKVYNYTKARL